MKRQADHKMSRVYAFGSLPDRVAQVNGEPEALDQMRLANRLWNVLVAIERTRIASYRRIMRDENDERIESLKQVIADARQTLKAQRKATRTRGCDPAIKNAIAEAKAEMSALITKQKVTKDERHAVRRADLTICQARANRRIKRARRAASKIGLYWGTYNDILERADRGRKNGGELQFRRFRGEGTVTAQIVGGASPDDCVDGDNRIFCTSDGYAHVRIGSYEDRSPRWLSIPVVMHREIPSNVTIKSVSATRRIVDRNVRWQVNVITTAPMPEQRANGSAIGVDIGWRLKPDGSVRVAYWSDSEGAVGDVTVAADITREFARMKALASQCDTLRDLFLPRLAGWLSAQCLSNEWTARSTNVCHWRSPGKLADLIRWWGDHRIEGDGTIGTIDVLRIAKDALDEWRGNRKHQPIADALAAMAEQHGMFAAAAMWRKRFLHLASWRTNLAEQLTLRVREHYRVFAADVAKKYATVYLEEFSISEVAKKPESEMSDINIGTYRQMASPSTFRTSLVSACAREGVRVVKVPASGTTSECHSCGCTCHWDRMDVMHRCENCGEMWDQDYNASRNILARGAAMADGR